MAERYNLRDTRDGFGEEWGKQFQAQCHFLHRVPLLPPVFPYSPSPVEPSGLQYKSGGKRRRYQVRILTLSPINIQKRTNHPNNKTMIRKILPFLFPKRRIRNIISKPHFKTTLTQQLREEHMCRTNKIPPLTPAVTSKTKTHPKHLNPLEQNI